MNLSRQIRDLLEFDKVLELIVKFCNSDDAKTLTRELLPFDNYYEATKEGEYVNTAKDILILDNSLPIEHLPHLSETLSRSRITGVVLDAEEILNVYDLACQSRKLFHFLSQQADGKPLFEDFKDSFFIDKNFEKSVSAVISPEGEIFDNASPQLRKIRGEIREKNNFLRTLIERILRKLTVDSLVQEEYVTQRDGRFVIPVKSEHKRHVRGFIHSESATGQTVYIEPEETLELNNELLSLSFAEKREIHRILLSLTQRIGELSYNLSSALHSLARIDSIFARAEYSIEVEGAFPRFIEEEPMQIINGRHPLLLKRIGIKNTVPLNLNIHNEKVVIITGPNAGGKTVVLKTVGLLSLLAQSGIHVPINPDSNFRFFSSIHIDIGDKQSIEDDLSTFSSHLSNIRDITDTCDSGALVLLDEIGTGTDPAEGSSIAISVLEFLRNKGAFVMATTHHGILKIYADNLDGFINCSMEFDTEKLQPSYSFRQGIPGSSYAFEVAERIGLSKDILSTAKDYVSSDKSNVEGLITELEERTRLLKEKTNQLEREKAKYEGLSVLYQKKNEEIARQKKEILEKSKIESQELLNGVNRQIEETIRNIKESNAEKEVVRTERKKIERIREKIETIKNPIQTTPDQSNIFKGDHVMIESTSTTGIVENIDQLKGEAMIIAGNLKLRIKISKLVKIKQQTIVKSPDQQRYDFRPVIESFRIDIRGKKPEEAEYEVLRFIDDAYAGDLPRIEILHGKGSGVLKLMVTEILKHHEHVKTFYYEKVEFGGEGITIAEIA